MHALMVVYCQLHSSLDCLMLIAGNTKKFTIAECTKKGKDIHLEGFVVVRAQLGSYSAMPCIG